MPTKRTIRSSPAISRIRNLRVDERGRRVSKADVLAREEPLEIRIRGKGVAVTMRTPGNDRELALGFLVSEGIIRSPSDVIDLAHCQSGEAALHSNVIQVFLSPKVRFDAKRLTRHVFASSSCGLCGKATIESIQQLFKPVTTTFRIQSAALLALPDALRRKQKIFDQTGALHAAALFDAAGEVTEVFEDVGRHNAVDKVIGSALEKGMIPLSDHGLLVSGRTSFEVVQKALSAGISFIASVSAPTSLAVEAARENNQTLAGFLRKGTFNLYTRPAQVI